MKTTQHSLTRLRAMLPSPTRGYLAKLAGITAATVQNIELGRCAISRAAAANLQDALGVSASGLVAGRLERLDGKDYTIADARRILNAPVTDEDFQRGLHGMEMMLRIIARAVRNQRSGGAWRQFYNSTMRQFGDTIETCGLSEVEIDVAAQEQSVVETKTITFGKISQELGDAPGWETFGPFPAKARCTVITETYSLPVIGSVENGVVLFAEKTRCRIKIVGPDGSNFSTIKDKTTTRFSSEPGALETTNE